MELVLFRGALSGHSQQQEPRIDTIIVRKLQVPTTEYAVDFITAHARSQSPRDVAARFQPLPVLQGGEDPKVASLTEDRGRHLTLDQPLQVSTPLLE